MEFERGSEVLKHVYLRKDVKRQIKKTQARYPRGNYTVFK
jgi:hypothetical protein